LFWLFITLNATQELHCTRQNLRHDNDTCCEVH
jgi:hypothetical protein